MTPSARPTAVALAVLAAVASADEVRLQNGATLHGELRPREGGRDAVVLRTKRGRVVLDEGRVAGVATESPAEAEYRRRSPTVSDTVDAQYALAMWCRDNGLGEAMRRRLRRVLELAPDHAEARALLGYQNIEGRWMTREEVLASRGLVRWEGGYRTKQEVELLRREAAVEAERLAWRRRLADWREGLEARDPEAVREADAAFDTLDNPAAAPELIELLREETDPDVRRRLVRVLGRLGTPAGLATLAGLSLTDPDAELRAVALEQLAADGRPGLVAPFVKALRSPDNRVVNHAGDALSVVGTPAVIDPLIDALVTTHKRRVGNASGGDTYSMNNATGTFGFGGGGPKIVSGEAQNPRVLAALVRLTGVNFLYDEDAWRAWLAKQQTSEPIDLRRDS